MITNNYYLIADIGGTNSNFELIEIIKKKNSKKKTSKKLWKENYKTNEIENFIDFINKLLNKFIEEKKILVENAILAVAGLIENGEVKFSNHKLKINQKELIKKTALKKVELINDFYALAHSIFKLKKEGIKEIKIIKKQNSKRKLIVGPGTGLGVAFITKKEEVIETEGGHLKFPIINKEELKLIEFLKKKRNLELISFEEILSGRGLENLYQYLIKTNKKYINLPKKLTAKEISKSKSKNLASKETFALFYKYLGRFLKNISLLFLTDEIYLAGGIIQKNIIFQKKEFLKEFQNNPKFKEYLNSISIKIIKDYNSSILGIKSYIERKE